MAHKKAGGSTTNVHDSPGQRLGVKLYHGQKVKDGQVIIKQRGTDFRPGTGVKLGNDDTIFATQDGVVQFAHKKVRRFTGKLKSVKIVNVQ